MSRQKERENKAKARWNSKRQTALADEYTGLLGEMEEKQSLLESGDLNLDCLLQRLQNGLTNMRYFKDFEDELITLKECRKMFREEIFRLKDEVELFRHKCEDQMKVDKQEVLKNKGKCQQDLEKIKAEMKEKKSMQSEKEPELKVLEKDQQHLERKQKCLDREEELLEREERLVQRQKQLEEFEKEIDEVEAFLNKRQAMCDRKHEDLVTLHEELRGLKTEIDYSNSESSEQAQRNWDIIRRNLMDRQKMLESNLQKYRTELASAAATITGKDIHIARIQYQVTELNSVIGSKDLKIQQLESRLAMTLRESRLAERSVGYSEEGFTYKHSSESDSNSLQNSPLIRAKTAADILRRNSITSHMNGRIHNNGSVTSGKDQLDGLSSRARQQHSIRSTHGSIKRKHRSKNNEEIPKMKESGSSTCTLM